MTKYQAILTSIEHMIEAGYTEEDSIFRCLMIEKKIVQALGKHRSLNDLEKEIEKRKTPVKKVIEESKKMLKNKKVSLNFIEPHQAHG